MRQVLKRAAVASRLPRWLGRRWSGPTVFCFHNVVGEESGGLGDSSLHLVTDEFVSYVGWIRDTYTVIPLSEVVHRVSKAKPLEGTAAITFDDAYRGVFAHAVPELQRWSLPATVFVVTAAAANAGFFWWDLLAADRDISEATRQKCLWELHGDSTTILERFGLQLATDLPNDLRAADWGLMRGRPSELITIGSHTVTHRNLGSIPPETVADELSVSRREIASALGEPPDLIAYPYGIVVDGVEQLARASGFVGGVLLGRKRRRQITPLELPRFNVPAGLTLAGLELRASGLV